MERLTRRQGEILDFIRESIRRDGLPPTRQEIMHHFGFASPNAVQCHLRALADKGAIRIRSGTSRGILPAVDADRLPEATGGLPLVGRVAAGDPILAAAHVEDHVKLPDGLFRPRPDYLLRVIGESMIDAGIHDGDLLAVHATPDAEDGRIVVARLDDEVTVKRLRRGNGKILLEPANPAYPVRVIDDPDDLVLEGVGVGVIRRGL